ncbi:hypothetical protein BH23CHL2_BH23CHL2_16090 [soil metagenome]
MIPGQILPAAEAVELPARTLPERLTVTNTGNVPVHLTAHFHLMEANRRLCFDRRRTYGMRLFIHAKGAVRIEPGETQQIEIVPIEGARRVYGFNGGVDGSLDDPDRETIVRRLIERGFCHRDEDIL